jgi:hypothetical protein
MKQITHLKKCIKKRAPLVYLATGSIFLICATPWAQTPQGITPQDASCLSCHTCSNPTTEDPCLDICARIDEDDVKASHAAQESPKIIIIELLANLYGPVTFDHQRHAQMSGMESDCTLCHHHSTDGRMGSCQECHGGAANPQNMQQPGLRGAYHRQCLGCHREWNHESACEECHAQRAEHVATTNIRDDADIVGFLHPRVYPESSYVYDTDMDPERFVTFHHMDHVEVFGMECMDCHRQENCGNCHGTSQHKDKVRSDPHEDCIGCHEDKMESDCFFCHAERVRERFDHNLRTNFEMEPYHTKAECGQCHTTEKVFSGLKSQCTSCHQLDWMPETFDHKCTGTVLDETHEMIECVECHQGGMGEPAACNSCHDEAPQPFPRPEN